MKISAMLLDKETKPMQIVQHPDFSRASWMARAEKEDTPLDSMLRGTRSETARALHQLGM